MAIVYSPNVIEIAVRHTVGAVPSVNVWHMYHEEELAGGDKESVVEDFRDNWQDHVVGLCHSGVVVNDFAWRSLDPGDGTVGIVQRDDAKTIGGAGGAAGFPPNVALLIHKNTSNRPRGRRDGRCYLGGIPEAMANNEGGLAAGFAASINADLADFYNGISDSSFNWAGDSYPVVLETTPASRAPGNAVVVIGSRRVTSITVDDMVATQRDRLR